MTDLEIVNRYIDTCLEFINPIIFREINARGLVSIVNRLPGDKDEARVVAYSRMLSEKMVFNEPQIDAIASVIHRLEALKKKIISIPVTEPGDILPVLEEYKALLLHLKDYFKEVIIP